jgi:hypothetical protein
MVPVPIRDRGKAITGSMAQALSLLLAAIPRISASLSSSLRGAALCHWNEQVNAHKLRSAALVFARDLGI